MEQEGNTLTCPVCGHTVEVEHYYDELEATQKAFQNFDNQDSPDEDSDGIDFNSFYTY